MIGPLETIRSKRRVYAAERNNWRKKFKWISRFLFTERKSCVWIWHWFIFFSSGNSWKNRPMWNWNVNDSIPQQWRVSWLTREESHSQLFALIKHVQSSTLQRKTDFVRQKTIQWKCERSNCSVIKTRNEMKNDRTCFLREFDGSLKTVSYKTLQNT